MLDLKSFNSSLEQLEQERGIPRAKVIEAIEMALAAAYKKDCGKKNQFIKAKFDPADGGTEFSQVKMVVDQSMLKKEDEMEEDAPTPRPQTSGVVVPARPAGGPTPPTETSDVGEESKKVRFNDDRHIMIEDAQKIKKGAAVGEELSFPLETKSDYGRIAAQTAKQVIIQKIREAEKSSVLEEYGRRVGEIITGTVQRLERGSVFVDLGRATGVLFRTDQIPGEHYRQGERIKAYLVAVEETLRGVHLRLSRAHPQFVAALFNVESPEIANKVVEIKAIAREAGSRTKMAIFSNDPAIDAVGSAVGQRGVRVSTVTSELGGEKIDIIEWSALPEEFIANSLSPGKILSIELDEETKESIVAAAPDQLSLVIGRGGQNVRLAAKLTGWKIDIVSSEPQAAKEKKEVEGTDIESQS